MPRVNDSNLTPDAAIHQGLCPECGTTLTPESALNHAQGHWGQNPDATHLSEEARRRYHLVLLFLKIAKPEPLPKSERSLPNGENKDTSKELLHSRTRAAIGGVLAVTLFALLWDVSKPLLAAITFFGVTALYVAEFGSGLTRIRRYIARICTILTFVLCLYAVVITVFPNSALAPMTIVSWLTSHGSSWLASLSLAPKWQERLTGALMLYAVIIVWTFGVPVLKRMAERAREEAASPTVRVTVPITLNLPREFVTRQRIKWDRVIQWTIVFGTMAALAFYGGLVKISALFVLLLTLLLYAVWDTHRRNK